MIAAPRSAMRLRLPLHAGNMSTNPSLSYT
jgi:hypothetical protein